MSNRRRVVLREIKDLKKKTEEHLQITLIHTITNLTEVHQFFIAYLTG